MNLSAFYTVFPTLTGVIEVMQPEAQAWYQCPTDAACINTHPSGAPVAGAFGAQVTSLDPSLTPEQLCEQLGSGSLFFCLRASVKVKEAYSALKKKRVRAGKPLRATLNPLGMGMQSYLSLHCEATKDEGYLKTDDLPKIGWRQEKEFGTTTIPILSLLIGRN